MARRGFRIDIAQLDGLSRTLGLTQQHLDEAVRRGLAGDAGQSLVREMRARTPRGPGGHRRGGKFESWGHVADAIKVHDEGHRGVWVGYQGELSFGYQGGGRLQKGAWLESGTKPHVIRAKRAKALVFGNRVVEEAHHPGSRALKIAQKSLKAANWSIEDAIIDELNSMAERAGWTGGYRGLD